MWWRTCRRTSNPSGAGRLQQAYERPTYAEARKQLEQTEKELVLLNESAAASLHEGLEETLTLGIGGDTDLAPAGCLPGSRAELQDDQLLGVAQRDGSDALRQRRSPEDLEPETPLDGGGVARHRTQASAHTRLSASAEAQAGAQAGAASRSPEPNPSGVRRTRYEAEDHASRSLLGGTGALSRVQRDLPCQLPLFSDQGYS